MTRIAIITGGSRGIGAATVRRAVAAGYQVCFAYRSDEAAANAVVKECEALGGKALAVRADIASAEGVATLFAACDEAFGAPQLLVNNAGILGQRTAIEGLSHDALKATFATNVFGAVYCAQEAVKRMSQAQGGAGGVIINISSMASRLGSPGEYVHYAASKGAVDSLTIGLAKELGPQGIRVNAVRSGTVDTDVHTRDGNPDRPAMVARTAPLGRVGMAEEIADAILWLASDEAAYTTGAILDVTGGL